MKYSSSSPGVNPEGAEARAVQASLTEIGEFRSAFRGAAGTQIVRDSILDRGLARPWLLTLRGRAVGYAGIWVAHHPGRVMELYVVPESEGRELDLVRALVGSSGATAMEAQTNLPGMARVLSATVPEPKTEKLLFREAGETDLAPEGTRFRARRPEDGGPEGPWVVERGGGVVAAGGVLLHYNPPWADLYMEVLPEARRSGLGSFLVQELRRTCSRAGRRAAARCDPGNEASARALVRGGLAPCGRILYGDFGDLESSGG